MPPGSWVFLAALAVAALIGVAIPGERARMVAALVLMLAALLEHLLMSGAGGTNATSGLGLVFFIASMIGGMLGLGVRTIAHVLRARQLSRASLATLVTLVVAAAIGLLLP